MLTALILLQLAAPAGPAVTTRQRYESCLDLAVGNARAAEAEAQRWVDAGGGFLARQCLGMAQASAQQWPAAAASFESAAGDAERAQDGRAATFWAQAGNAWLAAGDAEKSRMALDHALAGRALTGEARGNALLDRARGRVAGDMADLARADLDEALQLVPASATAWLLSATLARRSGDLPRAQRDIGEALTRDAEDPQVQLEAGNIAAKSGDATGARDAWQRAIALAPDSTLAQSAQAAIDQLGDAQ